MDNVEINEATWRLLDAAMDNARRCHQSNAHRESMMAYRNGAMDAVCAMTGMDPEALYEDCEDRWIARGERL